MWHEVINVISGYPGTWPLSAEQSNAFMNNWARFGAQYAIDGDMGSKSIIVGGNDPWFKARLDGVHCVHQVTWIHSHPGYGLLYTTWTCNVDGCNCDGEYCHDEIVLEIEGGEGGTSSCKNGDSLVLSFGDSASRFDINEIKVSGVRSKIATGVE